MNGDHLPGADDLTRIVLARASARLSVSSADESYREVLWTAFRTEIGKCVRRVSPFADALLDVEGLPLDELALLMEPAPGWPTRPLNAVGRSAVSKWSLHGGGSAPWRRGLSRPGVTIAMREGGRIRLHVLDHSIEVVGRVGPIGVFTAHGVLRLEVPGPMPRGLRSVCIGALASDLVDVAALRGRDWRVAGLELPRRARGWTFVVPTGSRAFLMPWVRPPRWGASPLRAARPPGNDPQ